MSDLKVVILAGGIGSRLWPLSRKFFPKQFNKLIGGKTMFSNTLCRLPKHLQDSPYIICNESTRFLAQEELSKNSIAGSNIILEPEGRNTAPAIALPAFHAISLGIDPIFIVLSADHEISNEAGFHQSINDAATFAADGHIVIFGAPVLRPETGYGYIKVGGKFGNSFRVEKFLEKPSANTASIFYNDSKSYLWNTGMFCFKASTYLDQLKKLRPEIYRICKSSIDSSIQDLDFLRVNGEIFKNCPSESIDNAILENISNSLVIPLKSKWSDIGSWNSLYDFSQKDKEMNVINGDVITNDVRNSFILSKSRLIAADSIDGLSIVETNDAILITKLAKSESVKKIVNILESKEREEASFHKKVFRPWGDFESLDLGTNYQVKKLTVKPGEKLSLQSHKYRSEHWVVISGKARVTLNNKVFDLPVNESVFIPFGVKHSLENPFKDLLEIIEVQTGTYLGEDDITRYEDRYGRE